MQTVPPTQNGTSPRLWPLLVAGISKVIVLTMRVAAHALSILGQWGKTWAENLRRKADRFHAIHVFHNSYSCSAPLPLLVPSRNVARRDVIRNEEDLKAAQITRTRFAALPLLKSEPELNTRLHTATFRGAITTGICYGASLCCIKFVLDAAPKSEEQLMAAVKSFEEGFPAEATGIHAIYNAIRDSFPPPKRQAFEIQKEYEQRIDLTSRAEEIEALVESYKQQLQNSFHHYYKTHNLKIKEPLSALYGLRLLDAHFHNRFDRDATAQTLVDQLPEGVYQSLLTSTHATAFFKFSFGSYLFDPNCGLMKCSSTKPSQDFLKLVQKYQSNEDAFQILHYNKI